MFSKLDVSNAFWHLELTEESSLLTTMAIPFGRYPLPFGLCVSSEIFQRHLHDALEGLEGVVCVADDIVVTGANKADHDANLHALLQRCVEKGISLNRKMCTFYCPQILFLGHVITAEGVSADPAKVRAITDMPEPQNVHDVRRFCGKVQYLAKYLPALSEVAKPLRDLTHVRTLPGFGVPHRRVRLNRLNAWFPTTRFLRIFGRTFLWFSKLAHHRTL